MPERHADRRAKIVLLILLALALVSVAAFLTLGAKGSWAFVLKFRGVKLFSLLLVAYAIAVSTILFQTVTNNRILTPSVMGFDSLYVLVQTVLFFTIGSGAVAMLDPQVKFLAEATLLVVFSAALYRWLFVGAERSLHLLVLVGIVFGVLFRSLSSFMQRVLDPNEFAVLQDTLFASFNTIDPTLLTVSTVIVALATVVGFRLMHALDVLSLGRPTAISLGVDYKRTVTLLLIVVSVLVAVSTALVGPVLFFGLLVAALAHYLVANDRHAYLLPAAILVAIVCLVGGQVVLERIFSFDTALSIIIEFLGGIVFISLILKRGAR
ncbi:iron chelate uptake ABC transporter family permease subunit [Shinella zoogloeoides]|uniref:iron chelate uptake ABC transporter family permease subunit n=1 Tax=Shinella zoogloeoides TaxID=352475 RepID=UPI0028AD7F76|nr:iron chelate uptake ABC transporter family permease subunit [Shinella zoogloeoides]